MSLRMTDMAAFPGLVAGVVRGRSRRRRLKPVRPRYLVFAPTYRCNLRCTMCGIHTTERFRPGEECTLDEFGRIFSDPLFRNFDLMRFTGGEPFLRKDFPHLVTLISHIARPRSIYITTNATLPDRISELLDIFPFATSELHLQLSIDAVGERLETMRGVRGIFSKVSETLDMLKGRRSEKPFFVGINQTIIPSNIDQLGTIQRLARECGFGYKFMVGCQYNENTAVPISPLESELPFKPFGDFSEEQLRYLYFEAYPSLRKRHGSWTWSRAAASSLLWKLSEGYLFEGEINRLFHGRSAPNPPCMTMFSYFRMMPDATIVPCNPLNLPAGNLRETPLSSLWFSDAASMRTAREQVVACKGCWVECDLGPSIYYSGDLATWLLKKVTAGRNRSSLRFTST